MVLFFIVLGISTLYIKHGHESLLFYLKWLTLRNILLTHELCTYVPTYITVMYYATEAVNVLNWKVGVGPAFEFNSISCLDYLSLLVIEICNSWTFALNSATTCQALFYCRTYFFPFVKYDRVLNGFFVWYYYFICIY